MLLTACAVDLNRGLVERAGARIALTTREAELLRYLADRAGDCVPRDELLAEVWQYADRVVSRACDNTIRRLREKIEADPTRPDHVLTVRGVGYRFVADPSPAPAPEASPSAVPVGRLRVDPARRRLLGDDGAVDLTGAEWAVLDALVDADGHVVARGELAERAFGRRADPQRRLDAIVCRLRGKLEPDPRHPALLVTDGAGYRLRRGDPVVERVTARLAEAGAAVLAGGDAAVAVAVAVAHATELVAWIDARRCRDDHELRERLGRALGWMPSEDPRGMADALGRCAPGLVVVERVGFDATALLDVCARHAPHLRWLVIAPTPFGPGCVEVPEAPLDGASTDGWAPPLREAARVLGEFRGAFSVEDAVGLLGEDAPDRLEALRERGLVWTEPASGALRLSAQREEPGRVELRRWIRWVARWGDAARVELLDGPDAARQVARQAGALDDLLHACARALELGEARLAATCARGACWVYQRLGPYGAGVALADRVLAARPPPALRVQLQLERARLHRASGDRARADADYAEVAALATDDPALRRAALSEVAWLRTWVGRADEARAIVAAALAASRECPPDGATEELEARLAGLEGRPRDERAWLERALEGRRAAGRPVLEADVHDRLGEIAWVEMRLGDALRHVDAACAIRDAVGLRSGAAISAARRMSVLVNLDDHAGIEAMAEGALSLAVRLGARDVEARILACWAGSRIDAGDACGARPVLDRAEVVLATFSSPHTEAHVATMRAQLELGAGDVARGRRAAERAVELYRYAGSVDGVAKAAGIALVAALLDGDLGAAREWAAPIHAAPFRNRILRFGAWCQLAVLALADGDGGEARRLLALAREEAAATGQDAPSDDRGLLGAGIGARVVARLPPAWTGD